MRASEFLFEPHLILETARQDHNRVLSLKQGFTKELKEMGGNAFKNFELRRIKREEIPGTLQDIAQVLGKHGLTLDYLKNNLMGSTGKKADSGDIDIAVDEKTINLHKILQTLQTYLGNQQIISKGLKGGQINTAWPIQGDDKNGFIQVDFIAGNPEWLKFSHHSPGDASDYPGVYISTAMGVLAKMNKDYEQHDDHGNRTARVGLQYDLEKGLHRSWQMQKRTGQGPSRVSPDEWESNVRLDPGKKLPPRFTRINYIDNPEAVLDVLLPGTKPSDVDTFEKLYRVIKNHPKYRDKMDEFRERFAIAVNKSSAIKNTPDGSVSQPPIFDQ